MKNKRTLACVAVVLLLTAMLSSCAIDRKCPAYSQANGNMSEQRA